uniref:Uncharacterized protein n=1 Tax=Glossina austeni TaxID=7395 RepID=A0A1A9UY40_GLOAU
MSMTILISVDSARLKAQNALCRMQFTSSTTTTTTGAVTLYTLPKAIRMHIVVRTLVFMFFLVVVVPMRFCSLLMAPNISNNKSFTDSPIVAKRNLSSINLGSFKDGNILSLDALKQKIFLRHITKFICPWPSLNIV